MKSKKLSWLILLAFIVTVLNVSPVLAASKGGSSGGGSKSGSSSSSGKSSGSSGKSSGSSSTAKSSSASKAASSSSSKSSGGLLGAISSAVSKAAAAVSKAVSSVSKAVSSTVKAAAVAVTASASKAAAVVTKSSAPAAKTTQVTKSSSTAKTSSNASSPNPGTNQSGTSSPYSAGQSIYGPGYGVSNQQIGAGSNGSGQMGIVSAPKDPRTGIVINTGEGIKISAKANTLDAKAQDALKKMYGNDIGDKEFTESALKAAGIYVGATTIINVDGSYNEKTGTWKGYVAGKSGTYTMTVRNGEVVATDSKGNSFTIRSNDQSVSRYGALTTDKQMAREVASFNAAGNIITIIGPGASNNTANGPTPSPVNPTGATNPSGSSGGSSGSGSSGGSSSGGNSYIPSTGEYIAKPGANGYMTYYEKPPSKLHVELGSKTTDSKQMKKEFGY